MKSELCFSLSTIRFSLFTVPVRPLSHPCPGPVPRRSRDTQPNEKRAFSPRFCVCPTFFLCWGSDPGPDGALSLPGSGPVVIPGGRDQEQSWPDLPTNLSFVKFETIHSFRHERIASRHYCSIRVKAVLSVFMGFAVEFEVRGSAFGHAQRSGVEVVGLKERSRGLEVVGISG